jgi:hypothetical protein
MHYCYNCRDEVGTVRDVEGISRCAYCDDPTNINKKSEKDFTLIAFTLFIIFMGAIVYLAASYSK